MTLTRYRIRNEFNLAEPELYRAADIDDPDALLEGVVVAGLVGLLRQLGDLAEFAAEMFHDLHEEVVGTAARGHGLMTRIQLLEADVPLIMKNLLSQTNHTKFYYNTGVDWHSQMCMDQNLITQGDMPQFIRDSYEECRGPPQLFLLDKFDISGAGACLKRYTDPSSFKAEHAISDATKLGVQRDRRTRKIKKNGSHWTNGGSPDVLTTSPAKLHRLLLEERIGTESRDSTRHVKLKKQILDGSNRTKSYMENLLKNMSPEHSETDEMEADQPILRSTYNHSDATERELFDIQSMSAGDDSLYFSHTGQEMKLRPSVLYSYNFSKSRRNRGSTVSIEDGYSIRTGKKLIGDGNNRNRNGISSPYYDATANETENIMDAFANMESEAETDNEYLPKKKLRHYSKHADVYDLTEQVLDSRSDNNCIISDDGSTSFLKGISASSSYGVPHIGENGNGKTYEAMIIDYSDSLEYDETEKTTSNRYLNANGETVGSLATPYNYEFGDVSFQKDLLQSSDSALTSRRLSPADMYYNTAPSEHTYESELPQTGRNRVNGGAVTTPDGPCMVDNVPVGRASIDGHESNDPSEVLIDRSMNFTIDHSKGSSMIEKEIFQKGNVKEFSSETSASEEVVSPQSAIDTQLQEFELPYQERDISSHLISPPNGCSDSSHETDSNDDAARPATATGESFNDFNHVMNFVEENVGNNASLLLKGHSYDDGILYTTKSELNATKSLSETHDSEGHISSEELLSERVLEDVVAMETDSGSNHDNGHTVSPVSIYLPSKDRNSDEDVICSSDSITQKVDDLQRETEVNFEGSPPLPQLGDTALNQFITSEVPMLSINQSPEQSNSYSRTEHGTQGNEEEIIKHPEVHCTLIKEEECPKQEIKSSKRRASWSLGLQNYEVEKLAEKQAFKLRRPRNPLIQSVDDQDRSKLKKVATINPLKAQTVGERGSILEQIRSKSFNLKPTLAPVPKRIIQSPNMNLKVAAILDKANKIRMATAGSDDEGDWE